MSKPFSQTLYNENNQKGIHIATHFLTQQGYEFVNDIESYRSHDFIVKKDNKFYKVEVEVSNIWKNTSFPFRSMTVPYRKQHSQADLFIQTNMFGNYLNFCPMSVVKGSGIIRKDTRYTTNEPFFNVSLNNIQQFILQDGSWSSLSIF